MPFVDLFLPTTVALRMSVLAVLEWCRDKAGQGGFPYLRRAISKFQSVLVSRFPGFLVSWFRSFLDSWLQSFKVSKLLRFENIYCVLGNIHSILPNFEFMFVDRHWSHIQNFEEFIKRILGIDRSPSLPKNKMFDFRNIEFYKNMISRKCSGMFS